MPETAGRPAHPRNTEAPLESETPGVPEPDMQAPVASPRVAGYIQRNGKNKLQPMPYSPGGWFCQWSGRQWGAGWVQRELLEQLRCHAKVAQGLTIFKNKVLGRSIRSIPAVPPSDPRYELAWKYAEFCNYNRRMMRGSWYSTVRQLVDGVVTGHRIAAIQARVQTKGIYKNKWVLDRMDVWPTMGYEFMQDEYGRFCAIRVPNLEKPDGHEDLDPRKFLHFVFRPENDNPYGTTLLFALCEAFYRYVQSQPELMALLTQYGRPGLYVIAPALKEGEVVGEIPVYDEATGDPVIDERTGKAMVLSPLQYNAMVTQEYKAGTVVNLAGGSLIGLLQATPGGDALFKFFKEDTDRDIMAVILGTDQLTESNRVVGNGNAGASEEIVNYGTMDATRTVEEMDETMWSTFLELNYGETALDLLPISDLGSMANPRITGQMNAVGGFINNGAFDEDQYYWYCALNGLPIPNPNAKKVVPPQSARSTGGNSNNEAAGGGGS